MSKWIVKTIGEICDLGNGKVQTGPFGSQLHQSDYQAEGYPFVMPKDIINGTINESSIARVSINHVERLSKHKLSLGDIIYGRRGDIGRQALVRRENVGWLCGSGCLRISLGNALVDPKFLHFYLKLPEVMSWVENQAIGATMPNLNTKILRSVPVRYPINIDYQQKIVSIISVYDDLIENNDRRITLLEKMAEEIYREWFVRLRFPGHEQATFHKGIPEGWEIAKLENIASFLMGQSPKSEFYNNLGDGLPFHQGVGTYGSRFPRKEVYCSVKGRLANKGDILFSVRAPVGRLNIADCEMVIGRGLASIRHKEECNSYLFYLLKNNFSNEDIIGNGSIFNSVGKDELLSFQILNLPDLVVKEFDRIAEKIDLQIENFYKAVDALKQTRDRLLTRLISGKLSVEDLDIQFPPSMTEAVDTERQ
jgi:type I restriction enzyme, S subunit